jgi:hypothetical protein
MSFHITSRLARIFLAALILASAATSSTHAQSSATASAAKQSYLGFDSNEYPGDENLAELRKTFAFSGYWLSPPPGSSINPWLGKRATIAAHDFGFLVLFNGRLEAELKRTPSPHALGELDAEIAAKTAAREGFARGTIIFLDQEEGGRLLDPQMDYVQAWIARVTKNGFRAGVYCSGIPVKDGKNATITTAQNIRDESHGTEIAFFIYNDACPPSPGCAYHAPAPSESGTPFAEVWQFAQSPRRKEYTSRCAATYSRDGNCHPLNATNPTLSGALLDLDSATSPDPSHTR